MNYLAEWLGSIGLTGRHLDECVALAAHVARAGMNLALLHADPDCPTPGGVALGGDVANSLAATGLFLGLALLVQAGVVVGSLTLIARSHGLVSSLGRYWGRLLGLTDALPVIGRRATSVPDGPARRLAGSIHGSLTLLRGPPRPLAAA